MTFFGTLFVLYFIVNCAVFGIKKGQVFLQTEDAFQHSIAGQ